MCDFGHTSGLPVCVIAFRPCERAQMQSASPSHKMTSPSRSVEAAGNSMAEPWPLPQLMILAGALSGLPSG